MTSSDRADRLRRVAAMRRRTAALGVLMRNAAKVSGGRQYQLKDVYLSGLAAGKRLFAASKGFVEHSVSLPPGFPGSQLHVRISMPSVPRGRVYSFADHVRNEHGDTTDRVLAICTGGFALSDDLGKTWRPISVPGLGRFAVVNATMLPCDRILLQAVDPDRLVPLPDEIIHLIVVNMEGEVLHWTRHKGARWHGPRAIDSSGDTLMYAEYTRNDSRRDIVPHKASRVFRSRDFGASWAVVYEEPAVRHFHFLQSRPGSVQEWWLTAGDEDVESRIWKSIDDGDTWIDQTDKFGPMLNLRGLKVSRRLFRLTDLVWSKSDVIWGCDDALFGAVLNVAGKRTKVPGSRVFRGNPGSGMVPAVLGVCGPEVRSIVELPDAYMLMTQASPFLERYPPRVFLLGKDGGPLVHLFDVGEYSLKYGAFTRSMASRSARNGTFFTYCPPMHVFASANQILKWEVEFG